MSKVTGKVKTVLGAIPANELGVTMAHEHLLVSVTPLFVEPEESSQRHFAYAPVTLENLGWIRQNWINNLDNLQLLDERTAIEEALRYRYAGGNTIVDPTIRGIGRDPAGLARISRATGLHIVMGSGYYVSKAHPSDMDDRSEDDIIGEIIRDIEIGVDDTGVQAGLIGEIGCSWPILDNERKVLRAAGQAQRETGAPLMIHPGRKEHAPLDIIQVLEGVEADLKRTIICHIDRHIYDLSILIEIASAGCYLEYDIFGLETSRYPFRSPGIDIPGDAQRLNQIAQLIEAGYLDHILVSHDICVKHRLARYGGHGYDHILTNVVPWMRQRGFKEEHIDALLITNPQRIFQFV